MRVFTILLLFLLTACEVEVNGVSSEEREIMEQAYATPQDVYTIDIGRETYRIPADYLVDADQRIDSRYVPKALEESRRDPQGSLF